MRGSRPSRILTATRTALFGPARLRAGDTALVLQAYGAERLLLVLLAYCYSMLWYGALVVAATELGVHAAGRLTHSRRVLEIGERFACLSHYSHDR